MNQNEQDVWLGLDIGGANIKAADSTGNAISVPFPLWKKPEELAAAITEVVNQFGLAQHLAVTMTGELADCYATKQDGVCSIVNSVQESWNTTPPVFYSTAGKFLDFDTACLQWSKVAAANWHALASYVARLIDGPAILLDIGSTTCDIIPINNRKVIATGLNDTDRLISGELVYTGMSRTPVASLVNHVSYRGKQCGIARELFATTLDVYLLLDQITSTNDDPNPNTADGKAANKTHAANRLARMICADSKSFTLSDAVEMAKEVVGKQKELITKSLERVAEHQIFTPAGGTRQKPFTNIVSGEGEFLAREIAAEFFNTIESDESKDSRIVELSKKLSADVASAAPAFAVAILASEGVSR